MGSSSRFLLGVVRRLLEGRTVESVALSADAPMRPAAVRSMLNELAEVLRDYVLVEGKRSRRYRLRETSAQTADPYEAVALALARELAVFLQDSLLDQHLQEAASRAAERLLPEARAFVPDLSRMIITKTKLGAPHGVDPSVVDLVVQCMLEGRTFKGQYRDFRGTLTEVTVHAYSLILSEEGLYVYGRCLDADKVHYVDTKREFNLGRFTGIRPLPVRKPYPSLREHDPVSTFDSCWGIFLPAEGEAVVDARIAFDARFAAFLEEHRYHRQQSLPRRLPDGSVEVVFRVYLTQDFIRFVRGFGAHQARPLGPERLVRWYKEGRDPEHPERIA